VLILPEWLVTSHDAAPRRDWGLRVVGSRVAEVGPAAQLIAAHPDDERVDAPRRVALPGFVNTHVHLYGVLAHGIAAATAPDGFWSFLESYWWPQVEDAIDAEMIAVAADWVCAEMLCSGTTTFYDILEAPHALPDALLTEKEVVERRGLRGVLSFEATERAGPEIAAAGLRENLDLIAACRDGDLVSGLMCYHATFTCSGEFIRRAFELAAGQGVLTHAHANEGTYEGLWCKQRFGKSTFEYYDDLGVASPSFLASQCVQLTDRDRAIIAERGIRVSHMPLSNCEVGGGIAPVPELIEAGVPVGLGSDGYINDFYEVMRAAFLLHKARRLDPGVMPAATVLGLATEGGAGVLGLDRVGRLDVGWSADLQLVDSDLATPVTVHNLVEQLVLWRNHSNVSDVMVAGRWRVRNGELLGADIDQMRARVHEQANRLWHR
jgi:cytosine/adenosine deaminase-related metal-dependent hydrolase